MTGKSSEIIALNVGGVRFETTRQTLTKYGNSVLGRMFAGTTTLPPAMVLKGGEYFIDRNPDRFRVSCS